MSYGKRAPAGTCDYCMAMPAIKTLSDSSEACTKCLRRMYTTTAVTTTYRPGRNDLCPCGSGKKWKRCCSRK